jgi:hypothetical protein
MKLVQHRLITLIALSWSALHAQSTFFPLAEIKPGLRGVGKTVFSGGTIEEFQVEVLGVLKNIGPKQSVILARLSGGPIDVAGVMQGMSGSPVYIDGRLVGAVAFAFPFATEPIAGIRPIEEMLLTSPHRPQADPRALLDSQSNLLALLPARQPLRTEREPGLVEIATPLRFGGFTSRTIETFAPQLRSLGLEPQQGTGGGGSGDPEYGDPSKIQPGSMISVQLLTGDLFLGADGTVTYVDGGRIYAFGHRFLSLGSAEMPFARAEVLTLLPNLATSFKIASPHEWMGTITSDRSAAIAGELGRRATLTPVEIEVESTVGISSYRIGMIRDRFLSPFLVQVCLFSAMDAASHMIGPATVSIQGAIQFGPGVPSLEIENVFSSPMNTSLPASLNVASSLAFAMQSGYGDLAPSSARFRLKVLEEMRELKADRVWTSRSTARPGETIDIHMTFRGPGGAVVSRSYAYRVPVGAPSGPLHITVTDSSALNLADLQTFFARPARDAGQVIETLNRLRPNNRAWLVITRQEQSFPAGGTYLPSPPPSIALVLRREQAAGSPFPVGGPQSRVLEKEFPLGDFVLSGSRTVRVEIKEE